MQKLSFFFILQLFTLLVFAQSPGFKKIVLDENLSISLPGNPVTTDTGLLRNNKQVAYRICRTNSGLAEYVVSVTRNEKMNIPNAEILAAAYKNMEDGLRQSAILRNFACVITDTTLSGIRCKQAHLFSKNPSDSTSIFFWLFIANSKAYSISANVLHGQTDQTKNETDHIIASVHLSKEALKLPPTKTALLALLIGKILICAIVLVLVIFFRIRVRRKIIRKE